MRTIFFSPHPDDETLACGGTIAKKTRAGEDVYIVFMTDGRYSHKSVFGIIEDPSPEEVKEIRMKEGLKAALALGVKKSNVFFLEFRDVDLINRISEGTIKVRRILDELKPHEVFVPHVYDKHDDHFATNIIIMLAVKDLKLDVIVYEYIIWFSDGRRFRYAFKYPDYIKTDISDTLETKFRALDEYESQVDGIYQENGRPILDEGFLSRFRKPEECFAKHEIIKGGKLARAEPMFSRLIRATYIFKKLKGKNMRLWYLLKLGFNYSRSMI